MSTTSKFYNWLPRTDAPSLCECGERVGDVYIHEWYGGDWWCAECIQLGWEEEKEEEKEKEAEIDYEKWTWLQDEPGPEEDCQCKCGRWFTTPTAWCPVCTAKEFKWTEAMMLKAKMVPLED